MRDAAGRLVSQASRASGRPRRRRQVPCDRTRNRRGELLGPNPLAVRSGQVKPGRKKYCAFWTRRALVLAKAFVRRAPSRRRDGCQPSRGCIRRPSQTGHHRAFGGCFWRALRDSSRVDLPERSYEAKVVTRGQALPSFGAVTFKLPAGRRIGGAATDSSSTRAALPGSRRDRTTGPCGAGNQEDPRGEPGQRLRALLLGQDP